MPARLSDFWIAYQFLHLLTVPWEKTPAFKLGLIDEDGNFLKRRGELDTQEERNALTIFHVMVWNIRKLLYKLPLGKTKLASLAAALYLIRESHHPEKETWDSLVGAVEEWIRDNDKQAFERPVWESAVLSAGTYVTESGNTIHIEHDLPATETLLRVPIFVIDGKPYTHEDLDRPESKWVSFEEAPVNVSGGVAQNPKRLFGGHPVVRIPSAAFHKVARGPKKKWAHWGKYIDTESEWGQEVRKVAKRHYKQPVILEDEVTGAMVYARHV